MRKFALTACALCGILVSGCVTIGAITYNHEKIGSITITIKQNQDNSNGSSDVRSQCNKKIKLEKNG